MAKDTNTWSKKIHGWQLNTWKNAQHHQSVGKCKWHTALTSIRKAKLKTKNKETNNKKKKEKERKRKKTKKPAVPNPDEDVESIWNVYTLLIGMHISSALLENSPTSFRNWNKHLLQDSAISLLIICPREMKTCTHTKTWTQICKKAFLNIF